MLLGVRSSLRSAAAFALRVTPASPAAFLSLPAGLPFSVMKLLLVSGLRRGLLLAGPTGPEFAIDKNLGRRI